ncbi:Oidioi.mRNA.OKI2018_I69.XSR.g13263.t1.cds [Oikopleura dioica]|uniref:Oidioi.mRNA.OKI2018_I69.XSR.g13263.t1.cds n=1 Tax=Oikopleura dioica TaxID=34765 RepID=A0ABN7S6E1_OIKDI|nr:Oidioi.mRNA.OKI2018_I69.XSR.g13263.t1.cds [Oikopleura dioica]
MEKMPKKRAEKRINFAGGGTSTAQMIRPSKQETAKEFLFQKTPTSVYVSRRFVKKMLVIGISEVCRQRLAFAEDEFTSRTAGDMKVQVLNPFEESGNDNADSMKGWLRTIFNLAEKGWLSKVFICIGKGNAPEKKPLEVYGFGIKETDICKEMDEHAVIDLTEDEDAQLRNEAEDLLQGIKKKIPKTPLDDVKFSIQVVLNDQAPEKLDLEDFHSSRQPEVKRARTLFERGCKTPFHKIRTIGVQAGKKEDDGDSSPSGW